MFYSKTQQIQACKTTQINTGQYYKPSAVLRAGAIYLSSSEFEIAFVSFKPTAHWQQFTLTAQEF